MSTALMIALVMSSPLVVGFQILLASDVVMGMGLIAGTALTIGLACLPPRSAFVLAMVLTAPVFLFGFGLAIATRSAP